MFPLQITSSFSAYFQQIPQRFCCGFLQQPVPDFPHPVLFLFSLNLPGP